MTKGDKALGRFQFYKGLHITIYYSSVCIEASLVLYDIERVAVYFRD